MPNRNQTAKRRDKAPASTSTCYQPISLAVRKFPGLISELEQDALDKHEKINTVDGLTLGTMEAACPASEEVPQMQPVQPVEREISLAEILQAITTSRDDISNVLRSGDVSPPVQAVLLAMLDRFEHVEKNAQSCVYGNAVVASVERTLSTLSQYSDEEIAEMRRLRAEVEEMVSEFKKVEKSRDSAELKERKKVDILRKYEVQKWT